MQISITIDDNTLEELDTISLNLYGKNKRSLLIQLMIKDYLMKYNYDGSKKA